MDDLMERVLAAHDAETELGRKQLLADCWADLNRFRIVRSQVPNARAVMSQIPHIN